MKNILIWPVITVLFGQASAEWLDTLGRGWLNSVSMSCHKEKKVWNKGVVGVLNKLAFIGLIKRKSSHILKWYTHQSIPKRPFVTDFFFGAKIEWRIFSMPHSTKSVPNQKRSEFKRRIQLWISTSKWLLADHFRVKITFLLSNLHSNYNFLLHFSPRAALIMC